MTPEYLLTWMMVFLRSLGVILQLPVLAGRPIPIMVRLGLCVCLATLLTGVVPAAVVPASLGALVLATAGEVLVGLALGFVATLAFAAVEMAGRVISSEIGLTATPGLGVPEPSSEPLAALLSSFAIVLFFLVGGHEMVLGALARSFHVAPPGRPALDPAAGNVLIVLTGHVLELGVRIAAPFIAMNFLVTLAFSVLGRAVPKMNVFVVSYSARAIAGFSLLATSGALIARYLSSEFAGTAWRMLQLLPPR
jgi:flagellar biosynthetic protein FliR